jgi:hypothetical protein
MILDFDERTPEKCRSSGHRKRTKRNRARACTIIDIARDSFHGRWLESAMEQKFDLELALFVSPDGFQVIISNSGISSEGKG